MVGRPRSIDRDKVLDAAEALVIEKGAAELSFESVARAAGITKSGVQYCFGTKENLIRSMIERWGASFETEVMERAGPDRSPRSVIRAHLESTRDSDAAEYSRSAAMMTALLQRPEQVAASRDWYTGRLASLDMTKKADRDAALAFLAGEGVFMLRTFGLIELGEEQWAALFADMISMADPKRPEQREP
ncbi:TetR/AcrR family transcriptional regulator [Mesorhizobium sp. YM1C-6-2]|jgi:AcrR family transcriptional regulator|uniref:TetR/AcrR family transcriptional regulator n=1 Tax=Mesorhizobium sp. YM1C-6-2 TaxID=1827501 RepID=UPI000EF1FDF6|nr:TetR/AcrR family transcriptional regulator [Mesorhizobium sp. YM1C-6-2]RLP27602.1 TetR/AcrR family transcriptional regulator [Mesorhizobium sp. YM1C-6-2]